MSKLINLDKINKLNKKFYEKSSDIKILQEELEDMLTAIDGLNTDINKGKISKESFDSNEKKFKGQSLKLIKKINKIVNENLGCVKMISSEIMQKMDVNDGYRKDKS